MDVVRDVNDAIKNDGAGPVNVPNPPEFLGTAYVSWEKYARAFDVNTSTIQDDMVERAYVYVQGEMEESETLVSLTIPTPPSMLLNLPHQTRDALL